MRLLVTGAGGLVGKLLVELGAERHDVLGLARSELDVTNRSVVSRAIREHSPEAARERGALVALLSTDYVFDGKATTPYGEGATTHPLSSYGRSKLEGERRLAASMAKWLAVRTGWLYGRGKGFIDWARARLLASEELPLIRDQTGSPTYARELAEAMLVLVEGGYRGLFHFVNKGEVTWLDLGRDLAKELGIASPRFLPINAEGLGRAARRPSYSALSVDKFENATGEKVRTWRDALRRYLEDR